MSTTGSQTATLASVATSTSTAVLVPAAGARKMATIVNDSAGVLFIAFAATASASAYTVRVISNGYYELPQPVYGGAISGILDTGTGNARVTSW
jgi:hypothetical protein